MYSRKMEGLIKAALADNVLTEKEKQVLFKKAQAEGIDLDEFEMVLDARLVEAQKAEAARKAKEAKKAKEAQKAEAAKKAKGAKAKETTKTEVAEEPESMRIVGKTESERAAPKSDKYGDIRKCPACGSIVGAFKGICPECGYEFANVDANLSSRKLYDALSKASTIQKAEIIETFPIPNTKADLLEFLTALKPRVTDVSSDLQNAYFKKYSECIEKAKISFAGDKQLQPFVDGYGDISKKIKRKKCMIILVTIIGIMLKYWYLTILIVLLICAWIDSMIN